MKRDRRANHLATLSSKQRNKTNFY